MQEEYENFIGQLNSLVGFLDVAGEDVFNVIKNHRPLDLEFVSSIGEVYSNNYQTYQNHITRSALLLGYAHFEAFLSSLMKEALTRKPIIMVPKGKQSKEKNISYLEFIQSDSKEKLIEKLAEKEIRNVLYKSINELIDYFEKRLKLAWTEESKKQMPVINGIRNCLMHNNGKVDSKLASISGYDERDNIVFTSGQVHSFGIMIRALTHSLLMQFKNNFDISIED